MMRNRWLVVMGALLVQPCLGAIYGWGVFVPALKATRSELVVTLSPEVLGVDRAAHAEVVEEYKQLKKRLAVAHSSGRDAAKADLQRFLDDVVPARVHVSDAVCARHYYGLRGNRAHG